jgi:ATP:corrinoid adenosyltransferase
MNVEERNGFDRLRELTNELDGHHRIACDAADKGDKAALGRAHIAVGRGIRSLQVQFARMAGDGQKADWENNQKTQNSDGMGEGTSDSLRAMHPLMTGDIAGFVARAFPRKAK